MCHSLFVSKGCYDAAYALVLLLFNMLFKMVFAHFPSSGRSIPLYSLFQSTRQKQEGLTMQKPAQVLSPHSPVSQFASSCLLVSPQPQLLCSCKMTPQAHGWLWESPFPLRLNFSHPPAAGRWRTGSIACPRWHRQPEREPVQRRRPQGNHTWRSPGNALQRAGWMEPQPKNPCSFSTCKNT